MNEAKRIANLPPQQRAKSRNQGSKLSPVKTPFDSSLERRRDSEQIEKKLLESVESLILGIKSGQLIREQESSNKRIQEILATVLDKESMKAFGFGEEETTGGEDTSQDATTVFVEDTLNGMKDASENVLKESDAKAETEKHSIESSRTTLEKTDDVLRELDNKRKEKTPRIDDYQEEVDLYLASLPERVTNEDLLNTNASRIKLHERVGSAKRGLVGMQHYMKTRLASDREQKGKLSLEERFARNMHLFCMLEHERRKVLLLPDELVDVTRKYHTRDKYNHVNILSHLVKHL